jgi:hypothetical protein
VWGFIAMPFDCRHGGIVDDDNEAFTEIFHVRKMRRSPHFHVRPSQALAQCVYRSDVGRKATPHSHLWLRRRLEMMAGCFYVEYVRCSSKSPFRPFVD